jgi:hypothetical protein
MIIAVAQERGRSAVKNPIWRPVGCPGDPEITSIVQLLVAMQQNPAMTSVTIE